MIHVVERMANARGLPLEGKNAAVVYFVAEAFNHFKIIGHVPGAEPPLRWPA